ncbi:MAG TPA: hypothetical protein VK164_11340 [Flavobacterium sp.]|uniref:hypothetical protein n=1 Tax=Flavobacterium sp. TaxID=239 RepID=UPI002B4B4159|nr:hypothetical protein [Flavobacterium sp.]HLO74522.1 hypothetical protein [Flavobacterium sp.]
MNIQKTLLLSLIIISCGPISTKNENKEKSIKWFLKEESILGTTYAKFGLVKENNKFYHNEKVIQLEDENHSYHYEIFDNKFILISIFNKPNIWSSPNLIPKDSLYIYELKKEKKSFISLKKTRFAVNKKELKNYYYKNVNMNDKFDYYFAIDSINLDTNELFLIDPNFKLIKQNLTPIN